MSNKHTVGQIASAVITGLLISGAIAAAIVTHSLIQSEQRARENFSKSQARVPALIPNSTPTFSQDSIKTALELYDIRLPENIKGPRFDASLTDRGLTTRRGALSQIQVTVGPEAFSSWAMLGSTIAHEIEVHCKQNFFAVHLMDMAGMDGTGQAEREAYSYELRNAARFGLSPYDQDLIRSTMGYYYPDKRTRFARQILPLRFWMDRMSAVDMRGPVKPQTTNRY